MSSLDNSPVTPVDMMSGARNINSVIYTSEISEKSAQASTRAIRSNSESSQESTNSNVRKARFAEATAVISPITGPGENRSPFADPPKMTSTATKPSDFGFGYIADNNPVEQQATVPSNLHPNGQPLKSALKTPGTAARFINPLSPTFREETMLEQEEEKTEKQQAADLVCCYSSRV